MSTLSQITTALESDKSAIRQAILSGGGTCPEGHGFDDFASDIGSIPSGSGVITSTPTFLNTNSSASSYNSEKEAKYDNNFLLSTITCYYSSSSSKYHLWRPDVGLNYDMTKYTDLIKIPCEETYTKADFTFNYDWTWSNSSSSTTPNNTSKTFRNIDIGTKQWLDSPYNSSRGYYVDFYIVIKKYDGYYTLSLNAYTSYSSSVFLYLYALKYDSTDKTMFSCTLYN